MDEVPLQIVEIGDEIIALAVKYISEGVFQVNIWMTLLMLLRLRYRVALP